MHCVSYQTWNVPAASTNQTSLPVLANTNIIGKPLNYGTHQQLQPVVKTDNDDEDDDVTIIDEEFNPGMVTLPSLLFNLLFRKAIIDKFRR